MDQIPDRAGSWYTKRLRFNDRPDEVFVVRHRDPIEAIHSLWGDPALSEHLVYRPKKIFSNANKDNRIYNEMWTEKSGGMQLR